MGRKKKRAVEVKEEGLPVPASTGGTNISTPKNESLASTASTASTGANLLKGNTNGSNDASSAVVEEKSDEKKSSGYAMTAHSAVIIDEDVYVSDGSSDEEEDTLEMLLAASRNGVMRRGIHHSMLLQPTRQWTRPDESDANAATLINPENTDAQQLEEEEALAKLDPAQRAARLLAEKQRKLEQAKETARRVESEENAGRDPCLFSKRTAFDIRFDQIDDKPWARGDPTDFFNYGLTEEDWVEYAEQQLTIRQELTDASRQKRPPDPSIVQVTPRAPQLQTPKVAVSSSSNADDSLDKTASNEMDATATAASTASAPIGPVRIKPSSSNDATTTTAATAATTNTTTTSTKDSSSQAEAAHVVPVGTGGAWGAGAAPGSVLAKLIEQQERQQEHTQQDHQSQPSSSMEDRSRWNAQESHPPPSHAGHYGGGGHDGRYGDAPPRGGRDWNHHFDSGGRGSGGRGYMGHHRGGRGGRGGRGYRDRGWDGGRKRPRDDHHDDRYRR